MNPSETNLEAEVSMEKQAREIPEDPPFHILFLGDFSGSTPEKLGSPIEIDRDNFDELLAVTAPKVSVEGNGDTNLSLQFKDLDDFHPDTLFRSVSLFDDLRNLRARLLDERAFGNAAKEVRSWFAEQEDLTESDEREVVVEGSDGLLDDILGSKDRDVTAYKPSKSAELKDFISKIVDPHLVRVDEEEQSRLIEAVDEATSGLMRTILSDRSFQNAESIWRGMYFACRNIDTNSKLKLFFLDISKERYIEELKSEDGGELADILLSGHAGEPWAVVTGSYDFDLVVDDVAALMRAAGIAGVTSSPFVSHMRPSMLGISSFDAPFESWDTESETSAGKLWTVLRGSPEAESLGLVAPRLLSRLPYGKDTDPTETFEFEEVNGIVSHDEYVWMNPIFGFAVAMGQSFSKRGWEMGGRYELDLSGFPTHVYKENGETLTKPCAECEMTDQGLELLLEQGLIPMASFRGSDRVRVGGVQSVKFPNKGLKGRWS